MTVLALIEELVKWLGPAFATAGYWIIAAAVLMERSILLGLIIPGDVIIALGGIYAAQGDLNLAWVIVIATIAAISGESIGYWLGRQYGKRLIRRLPLVNRLEGKLEDAQKFFARHGGKTVAIGRYATAAGAFVPFVAGLANMSYPRFLAFDVPAIAVWATAITLLGYFFEHQLDTVDTILSRFGWFMLGAIVLLVAGRILWKRFHSKDKAGTRS